MKKLASFRSKPAEMATPCHQSPSQLVTVGYLLLWRNYAWSMLVASQHKLEMIELEAFQSEMIRPFHSVVKKTYSIFDTPAGNVKRLPPKTVHTIFLSRIWKLRNLLNVLQNPASCWIEKFTANSEKNMLSLAAKHLKSQMATLSYSKCNMQVCIRGVLGLDCEFLDPSSGSIQQVQKWGFLFCTRIRVGVGFRLELDFITEKNLLVVCLICIYPDSNRSQIS